MNNEMVLFPVFQAEHSAHARAFGAFIKEHCFITTCKKKDLGSAYLSASANQMSILPKNFFNGYFLPGNL